MVVAPCVFVANGGLRWSRDAAGVSLGVDRTRRGITARSRWTPRLAVPIAGDLAEAIEEATLAVAAYLLGVPSAPSR